MFGPARAHLVDLDRAIRHAPDLCVEVLSPSTEATDRGRKLQMFARYGVPEYWLVIPCLRQSRCCASKPGATSPPSAPAAMTRSRRTSFRGCDSRSSAFCNNSQIPIPNAQRPTPVARGPWPRPEARGPRPEAPSSQLPNPNLQRRRSMLRRGPAAWSPGSWRLEVGAWELEIELELGSWPTPDLSGPSRSPAILAVSANTPSIPIPDAQPEAAGFARSLRQASERPPRAALHSRRGRNHFRRRAPRHGRRARVGRVRRRADGDRGRRRRCLVHVSVLRRELGDLQARVGGADRRTGSWAPRRDRRLVAPAAGAVFRRRGSAASRSRLRAAAGPDRIASSCTAEEGSMASQSRSRAHAVPARGRIRACVRTGGRRRALHPGPADGGAHTEVSPSPRHPRPAKEGRLGQAASVAHHPAHPRRASAAPERADPGEPDDRRLEHLRRVRVPGGPRWRVRAQSHPCRGRASGALRRRARRAAVRGRPAAS